jgi:aspartate-semialdehyde dehydrogenase
MKIAVIGASGLVGQEVLRLLEMRNFQFQYLIPVASPKSIGKMVQCKGQSYRIIGMEDAIALKPEIAIFSAGGGTSLEWAPKFAEIGTVVIDNSSAWRMDPTKKLVVPEVNGNVLMAKDKIIANPNCSTIQLVLPLLYLHKHYRIKRIVVSTYQSITGTGKAAVDQMEDERAGVKNPRMVYPHTIDKNVFPHIDMFQANGYTKEEMKMTLETKKIMNDDQIQVTATCVRIPTIGGHSESVNIEFEKDFEITEVRELIAQTPGCIVADDPKNNLYPMPISAYQKDEVFIGRIRRDESQKNSLNMWIVADNLRKGAATNALQIAEYIVAHQLI